MRQNLKRTVLSSRLPLITLLATSLLGAGCSWSLHSRAARPGELLHLESVLVTPPSEEGWRIARAPAEDGPRFVLQHAGPGRVVDRSIEIVETKGAAAPLPRGEAQDRLTVEARKRLGDPAGQPEELPFELPPGLGSAVVAAAVRVTESHARAGSHVQRVVESLKLVFVPSTDGDRTVTIIATGSGTTSDLPNLGEAITHLLEGIEPRAVDAASTRDAARDHGFPKQLEPELSRRSLTLPRAGFQWEVFRERWTSRKDFTGTWGLAYGITDHLELSTPGYLRYSFGESDARTRPELAVGAGFTGLEHDAVRGDVWGAGLSLEARQRLSPSAALRAQLFGERLQESRTRKHRLGGGAVAGVVYDPIPLLSVNLEAGYSSRWWSDQSRELAWIGGRSTPLLTLHLPLLDVGLVAAAAWDEGKPGMLVGFSTLVTF
jgi:hypothetical protein